MIRDVLAEDAPRLCAIYNHYVQQTDIAFETQPLSCDAMAGRVAAITPGLPWLVFCEQERVLGYAFAAPWREQAAYGHSAESAIYLDPAARGRNLGTQLYRGLLARLRNQGVHTVLAGIALPNGPSIRLHQKLGFRKVAHFSQIGCKQDRWIDVSYWQITLGRGLPGDHHHNHNGLPPAG